MTKLLPILFMSILLSGEMEVDGDLKVTGTIQNDSLAQVIAQLEARIAQLECTNSGNIPAGYCDCFGNVNDACGTCNGIISDFEFCIPQDPTGLSYPIILLGDQLWLAENARYTPVQPFYSCYDDLYANCITYGGLYDYNSANSLCSEFGDGWHLPSDEEWKELEVFIGMNQEEVDLENEFRGTNEGSKLAGSANLWVDGDLVNNFEFDITDFNILPGGYYSWSGFHNQGIHGYYWTSTIYENNYDNAYCRQFYSTHSTILRVTENIEKKFSVRCIKD